MSRTTRRILAFDAMEGRVLLSSGMADPAAVVHRAKVNLAHFLVNGTYKGIPYGTVGPDGITVSSFNLAGKAQSMGNVAASLALSDPIIAPGNLPDLTNATLTLSNKRGSIQLKMASSPSNRYIFIVTNGAGVYSSAFGSGTAVISYLPRLHEYQVALRSSTR